MLLLAKEAQLKTEVVEVISEEQMAEVEVTVEFSRVTPTCVLLQLAGKHFYVQVADELVWKLDDHKFLLDLAAALQQEPSQQGGVVSPYTYYEKEGGVGVLAQPSCDDVSMVLAPPDNSLAQSADPTVQELSMQMTSCSPFKVTQRLDKSDSPMKKRMCKQPTPQKSLFKTDKTDYEEARSIPADEDDLEGIGHLPTVEGSTSVKFSNLPQRYGEVHFLGFVRKKFGIPEGEPLTCSKIRDGCVVVKFHTPALASRVAAPGSFAYSGGTASVSLVPIKPDVCVVPSKPTAPLPHAHTQTRFLLFENVPPSYTQRHFEIILRKKCSIAEKVAVKCSPWNEGQVIVEFSDEEVAENVATLEDIGYGGKTVKISLHYVAGTAGTCKAKVMTKFVQFIKVADTYEEENFISSLKDAFGFPPEVILKCSSYIGGTVVVECPSTEIAKSIADRKKLVYDEIEAEVSLHNEALHFPTKFLKFHNVPDTYEEGNFLNVLRQVGGIPDSTNLMCSTYVSGVVIVKFPSEEMAENTATIGKFKYDDDEVFISLHNESVEMPMELGGDWADEESAVDPDSVQTLETSLRSARAKHAFLEECRHSMKAKPPFRASTAALEVISDNLNDLHNINVTVAMCKKAWRHLTGLYSDKKKNQVYNWDYYDIIAELKGDAPRPANRAELSKKPTLTVRTVKDSYSPKKGQKKATASSLSPPSKKPSKAQKLASFSKGRVWYDGPTRLLIERRKQRNKEFDAVGADKKVWDSISVDLAEQGFYYDSNKCRSKWNELVTDMKDYIDNENCTGRGPKEFDYVEEMSFIRKWVNVNPEMTLSLGCTPLCTVNPQFKKK